MLCKLRDKDPDHYHTAGVCSLLVCPRESEENKRAWREQDIARHLREESHK